ncbi:MAG: Gfo/Idh/MocA family oxidoreductase [Patescibacteria group bacterium]
MVRVGIIGSGFGLYGLLPAFNSIKNCRVVCVCGKKSERLVRYCESINLKNIYLDWRKMLENEKLDALVLAVVPNAQYQIAKVAIKKNLNIFAEKPLAANYQQAKELLNLAQKHKIVHAVDFIFPEIEEWQEVKRLIDKEAYGKLKHISVRWNFLSHDIKNKISSWKTDVKEGGGALSFYFSHVLYYIERFAGEILGVSSLFSYSKESLNKGEVDVDALIKFKNGVIGNAHINCNDRGLHKHQLIFICEHATIILENEKDTTQNFKIKIYKEKIDKALFVKKNNVVRKNEDERVRVVRKIAARFIDGCSNKTQIRPSFVDGLRVQELIDLVRNNKI